MVLRRLGILVLVYAAAAAVLIYVGGQYKQELFPSIWAKTIGGGMFEVYRGESALGTVSYTPLADNVKAFARVEQPEQLVFMQLSDGTAAVARRSNETRWAVEKYPSLEAATNSVRGLKDEELNSAWRKPQRFGGQSGAATLLVLLTAAALAVGYKIIRARPQK